MGDVSRILITGASGFIGQATVSAALDAGLEVVAVQRRSVREEPGVTSVSIDLTDAQSVPALTKALAGCDAVIHLAAALSGHAEDHAMLTIGGTRNLIVAMHEAGVSQLTLASSLAVYDTGHVPVEGTLTDTCPLVAPTKPRDSYSDAKRRQETIVQESGLGSFAILRPGIVYDDAHLWNAHLGVAAGPVLLRIGDPRDLLPMCHVGRCAAALVQSAILGTHEALAVLDPVLPTREQVIAALRDRSDGWPKAVIPVPVGVLRGAAYLLQPVAHSLPGLLRADVLRQRALPMHYALDHPFASTLPDLSPDWGALT